MGPPAPAQEHRAPTSGPALPAVARHLRQPLFPIGRELLHYLSNRRRKWFLKNASPADSEQPVGTAIATHAGIHTARPFEFASPLRVFQVPVEILVIRDAQAVVRRCDGRPGAATALSWSRDGGRTCKKSNVSCIPTTWLQENQKAYIRSTGRGTGSI